MVSCCSCHSLLWRGFFVARFCCKISPHCESRTDSPVFLCSGKCQCFCKGSEQLIVWNWRRIVLSVGKWTTVWKMEEMVSVFQRGHSRCTPCCQHCRHGGAYSHNDKSNQTHCKQKATRLHATAAGLMLPYNKMLCIHLNKGHLLQPQFFFNGAGMQVSLQCYFAVLSCVSVKLCQSTTYLALLVHSRS